MKLMKINKHWKTTRYVYGNKVYAITPFNDFRAAFTMCFTHDFTPGAGLYDHLLSNELYAETQAHLLRFSSTHTQNKGLSA